MRKIKDDKGMLVVEASIVFPVMFLVILFMIFAGNSYLQKCRIEAIVIESAISGASYCADPILEYIENDNIPTLSTLDVQPYRFLIGGMDGIEEATEDEIADKIDALGTGLFSNMSPDTSTISAEFYSNFIYSTFSCEVEYDIMIPIKLLGASDYIYFKSSSKAEVAVSDTSEFIKNIKTVEDYMERYGITEKITEMAEAAKAYIN